MSLGSSIPKCFYAQDCFIGQIGNIVLCLKIISQKWTAFVLGDTNLRQTFTECVSNQYAHFDLWICQMWLQVMERHWFNCVFLSIFIHNWRALMSEVLHLHQIFTDCLSDWYTHFGMATWQMWLQVMEGSLV